MKKELIKELLKNSPPPYYLLPETVVISEDSKKITGKVNFPSSEESIGKRHHVNVAHSMFAVWNFAHILSLPLFKGKKKQLWCVEHTGKAHHMTPMDADIDVECNVSLDPHDNGRGTFNAEFSLAGKPLQTISAVFVAK